MRFFFLDDARQKKPTRAGMGPLVAVGGFTVRGPDVGDLERALDAVCAAHKFPSREEFKWSPGRELWMRDNLVGEERSCFFRAVVDVLRAHNALAIVIIEDTTASTATKAASAELDVVRMCLERVCILCGTNPPEGVVIADRSLDGKEADAEFLAACLDDIQTGAGYIIPDALALNVISTPSKFVRLLQAADLITGATLAAVAGEEKYAPQMVDVMRPLYRREYGRIGGCGVKIHPDFKYANLYHWVFGDEDLVRFQNGTPLPLKGLNYADNSATP